MFLLHPQESLSFAMIRAGRAMVASRLAERQNRRVLEMIVVLIRALALACRGHHELVLENLALRQQLCLANIAPGQKSLTLASPVGTLRGDASRHQDGCCGPIGSGNASRPPARDSCPAPSTRRPRAFEYALSTS